jgi:flotillin
MDALTLIEYGVGLLVTIILVVSILLRRVVPTNMVHIVQSSKNTTAYGKGKTTGNTYYEFPASIPVIGVSVTKFPESIFQISLNNYEAYDSTRLPFIVDVSAFFRVDSAETAAQRVSSFQELNAQLEQVLQGSVRKILATNKLSEIMSERTKFGTEFTEEIAKNIAEWGVLPVKSIEFMDIRDSSKARVIADIMEKEKSSIEKESRIAVAENLKEAQLKEIAAQQEVQIKEQESLQMVGQRTAEKEKAVGIAKEQASQDIQEQAKITAEKLMEVKLVEDSKAASIEKTVATTKAEQDKDVRIKIAEGVKESAALNAEAIVKEGEAKATAEKAMLMAPIDTQIALAKEIGENINYQEYLLTIEKIKNAKDVGIELAKAMQKADIKIISNANDPQSGMSQAGDLFSAKNGLNLSGMLSTLSASPEGAALLKGINTFLEKTPFENKQSVTTVVPNPEIDTKK